MGRHSSGKTLFEEYVATGTTSHTAEFIYTDIKRVIDNKISMGIAVSGATIDNTSANKRAWSQLVKVFPFMLFQRYICHGLHLLVKDILESIEDFSTIVDITKEIVLFVFRHHKVLCELKERRSVDNVSNLVKPAPTRWGKILASMESLYRCEPYISVIFNKADFITQATKRADRNSRTQLRSHINSTTLITQLKIAIAVLKPFCNAILKFETDDACVSEVYHEFAMLKKTIEEFPAFVPQQMREVLQIKLAARWNFMYADSHGIAYLLDPRYLGALMPKTERDTVENFICFEYEYTGVYPDSNAVLELANYKVYVQRMDQRRLDVLIEKKLSVYEWWNTMVDVKSYPFLTEIALRVFSVLVSASSCERNWSSFGFIQNKLRNRLSDHKTQKLVFVHSNMKELHKNATKKRKRVVVAEDEEGDEEDGGMVDFPSISDDEGQHGEDEN